MRHSDFRGLEKNAQEFDEEYEGLSARSVDDHYDPLSPNTSSEFLTDTSSRKQQHSIFSFVATKQNKKKKNKDVAAANKFDEDELPTVEENPPQTRGRLISREYSDIQFDMEPEDDMRRSTNQGKLYLFSQNTKKQR
jgi:hypothetical protein